MSDAGYATPLQPNADANQYNAIAFIVQSLVGKMATFTLVEVMSVTNDGGVSPVGTVSVKPCVNQVDGALNGTPHGTIFNLPYVRVQGGAKAIILDPEVGDIGVAGFCSTDTSVVRSTGAAANPGSRRRFDWADGVYIGLSVSQTTPTDYVQFAPTGITIVSGGTITLQGTNTVAVVGDLTVSGSIVATGEVTGNGIDLSTHVHSGVTTGSGDTGAPV